MTTRSLRDAAVADERWHALTSEVVLARVSSDRRGLSAGEAARRLVESGPNRITRRRGPTAWAVLARQFASPLIYSLLVAAVVAVAFGDLADGAVVLGVVVLNALIGFVQEFRAGRAIQALAQLVAEPATVLRDGRWTRVDAADLVPGDVEMMLRRAWTPTGDEAEFDGIGYEAAGRMLPRGRSGPLRDLLIGAALANEAQLDGAGDRRTVLGDPTDGALLVAAERGGVDLAELFRDHPRRAVLPFDSERGYMASSPQGSRRVTYFKGAPEVLLAHVNPAEADAARAVLDAYAADGMRVLAIGARYDTDSVVVGDGRLRLLGLVALTDPLRPEVVDAVAACHRAGISVKMITGDHAATAAAIGRDLGIAGHRPPMTGAEIARLPEDELRARVRDTGVFARVAPEHKLKLVRALQAGGAVTAMTGDGVNDAPALRQADIGVAMGRAGTAAAKEAADIVLGDDNFATIRAAVEEGRRVYDNLIKALAFVLPTNVGEALIVLVAVLAFPVVGGAPVLPVEPVQILWINLVATVSLALPLAFEAQEPDSMRRPPRDPDERLLSRFVVVRTLYAGVLMAAVAITLFLIAAPVTAGVAQAQTLAVTSVAFFQIFYLLMCRTITAPVRSIGWTSNRYVFGGIAALLALQAAVVHLQLLQTVFHTEDLTAGQWMLAAAAGAVVIPVVAAEKWWRRSR